MASDYKPTPYKPDKEFHKCDNQNWVILRSNEGGRGYEKPEKINLNGSRSIIGHVEGNSCWLLFQANHSLVSNEGKPTLAKVSFGSFVDEKWTADEAAAKAWKENYEASNMWCALECNFPVLKLLATWLHNNKLVISELIYLNNTEGDQDKVFAALDKLKQTVIDGGSIEEDQKTFDFLYKYGLEAIEFEEKISKIKSKIPPLINIRLGEDDFITYDKANFTSPSLGSSYSGGSRKVASESEKANSRLDFLLNNSDKVKQLFTLYPTQEQLAVALAIAGIQVNLQNINNTSNVWEGDPLNVDKTISDPISVESTNIQTLTPTENKKDSKPTEEDLKEIIDLFGDAKTTKWLSSLDGLESTGNPVSLATAVKAVKNIINSNTHTNEVKNVMLWAKQTLKLADKAVRGILDLDYENLLTVSQACLKADFKSKTVEGFSILDLRLEDLDLPAF